MITMFRRWRILEAGVSGAALFILSLPLMIGVFGFGFDAMRLAYAKRIAQGRLDLATQSAAAVTYTRADGTIQLGTPTNPFAWRDVAYNQYAQNTSSRRKGADGTSSFFQCPPPNGTVPDYADDNQKCAGIAEVVGTPPPLGFNFCQPPGSQIAPLDTRNVYGVRMSVKEQVPTSFLKLIGIRDMTFGIRSESLIRQRNC